MEITRLQQADEIPNLKAEVDALKNRQRRDNLIFYNVPFTSMSETWDQSKRAILDLCEKLGFHKIGIDRTHRIGKNSKTRTAPIVARILSTDD